MLLESGVWHVPGMILASALPNAELVDRRLLRTSACLLYNARSTAEQGRVQIDRRSVFDIMPSFRAQ